MNRQEWEAENERRAELGLEALPLIINNEDGESLYEITFIGEFRGVVTRLQDPRYVASWTDEDEEAEEAGAFAPLNGLIVSVCERAFHGIEWSGDSEPTNADLVAEFTRVSDLIDLGEE
jgi:hypothetical protein